MSPRTKTQFDEMRLKSRQNILDAALELFAEKGFHNTSIQQIAARAGVSKGLMYNYFDSKDKLLDAIMDSAMAEGDAMLQEELHTDHTPKEKLRHLLDTTFNQIRTRTRYYKLLMMLSFQNDAMERFNQQFATRKQAYAAEMIALFTAMHSPNPMADTMLLAATVDGMALHFFVAPHFYPFEEVKNHLFARFGLSVDN